MSLDDLLHQPLAPVQDRGFSAAIVLHLERTRQRRLTLLWALIVAAVLPVLWFLPFGFASVMFARALQTVGATPLLPALAGILVVLWAWQARLLRL